MSGEQAIFNLQIKKKIGISLNPDIHHSKVFSSVRNFFILNWQQDFRIFDSIFCYIRANDDKKELK